MKPILILGLGNSLMGDDGVGGRVAELLAREPRLPVDVEALCGGTDLLHWADEMEGRERVVLIDAILGEEAPGTVEVFEDQFAELGDRQWNVHHLSTPQALRLLQAAMPGLAKVRFTLIGVTIASVEMRSELSPGLTAQLPAIADCVLRTAH